MNALCRTVSLADVARVHQGHPFRGAIPAVPDGPTRVIRLKNLSADDALDPEQLLRTRLRTRKRPQYVQAGDILLAGRGNQPIAMLAANPPEDTVCSPHLYLIQVTAVDVLLPAFLAWQLNQHPLQQQLRRQAAGTRQQSLRKSAVEQLQVQLPLLETQRSVVAIAMAALQERTQVQALAQARQQAMGALAHRVLRGGTP